MTDLSKQSELLQGLEDSWRVTEVDLSREEQKVGIRLEADPLHDHHPQRPVGGLDLAAQELQKPN